MTVADILKSVKDEIKQARAVKEEKIPWNVASGQF